MLDQNEIELFRDNVKKFLENEVAPHYDQWEKAEMFPRGLWNKMGENGLLCVDVPEEYGGFGANFRLSAVIVEEASRAGYGALASNISVHSDIVAPYILHLGSEEQKQTWLPKMVSGEAVGAIGMTEPGAGSDLQGMKTRADKDGDGYKISGQKTFITNGQHCDVIVLATKTDPNAGSKGMTLFTVDCALPGFARGRNLEKMGHHAADTSELFFEDVKVGADQILGGEGKGFANLMNELPRERLILALGAIAVCEGMIERTPRLWLTAPTANSASSNTIATNSPPPTPPSPSSPPPSCKAWWPTNACSCSVATATCRNTPSPATTWMPASSVSTAAPAKS